MLAGMSRVLSSECAWLVIGIEGPASALEHECVLVPVGAPRVGYERAQRLKLANGDQTREGGQQPLLGIPGVQRVHRRPEAPIEEAAIRQDGLVSDWCEGPAPIASQQHQVEEVVFGAKLDRIGANQGSP